MSVRINRDGTGLITRVHEQTNSLRRRAAGRRVGREQILVANVDCVFIVQAVTLPQPNPGLIDRLLVAAESQEIPCKIIINKIDLASQAVRQHIAKIRACYSQLGYPVLQTSATLGTGLDILAEHLAGNANVFTGPSGVGKSSLINAIAPQLQLRTGTVSLKTRKGRHVTAYAELFPIPGNGYVVDMPGIREFGVLGLEPWELSHYFPEFRPRIAHCHFSACTHDHEPGCMVREAVASGAITPERYRSYLNILESIRRGAADVGR